MLRETEQLNFPLTSKELKLIVESLVLEGYWRQENRVDRRDVVDLLLKLSLFREQVQDEDRWECLVMARARN